MASTLIYTPTVPIFEHAFNADRSEVAITTASNKVEILSKQPDASWKATKTFSDHEKIVTCVDWAPNTNRIVTCSQDRNAYVYEKRPDGSWKQTLVLLRINRAATTVRWSPKEDKFAVGSGARVVSVCYFEEENDWWVSKHLKKPLRSTILSLDWHPNNVLLATGCADRKVNVLSAYIRDVDSKPNPSVWGARLPFNTICADYVAGGWVHSVKFSPSGDALAFASHDSTVTIVYPSAPDAPPRAVLKVQTSHLPLRSILWANEMSIVAAGHNCSPILLQGNESEWTCVRDLDPGSKQHPAITAADDDAGEESGPVSFSALRSTFRNMDLKGSASMEVSLPTVHQNSIASIRPYTNASATDVSTFSSSGADGRVVIWQL
ncbi:ARP2/3 actin-organizing complex subunit Sop2 [Schizosaccharomyces japonicus yFS275]|uniref:Actin-related protein 2/3 complex subunit n=1 Tax=Schizosaccharomyces japonicus (strain yFS275 / FY16936) TaxID=402676 RepID=B6JZN3_SCHJY|nr:ARP2/3 actin-organizing complex subunit Sop2 [Schizosaccharomyces japonicus yFS275]EEB07001.1 ARP2/3 actin-organizing complex subunit Sop2 [Schizosaccharomyces japonicus yFS275]